MTSRRAPSRRRASAVGVLGWGLVASILVLGRPFDRAAPEVGPVDVVPEEPEHTPVRVTASPPAPAPAPAEKPAGKPATEPAAKPTEKATAKRPFAALRTFKSPLIMPRLALPRVLTPRLAGVSSLMKRAKPGEPLSVTLTAYCLRGRTRRGRDVRPGIIAADPRIFPLARHVELFSGGRYLGKFLVDDTGGHIRGQRIDIWTPDCADARRFGRRSGIATLVAH